MSTFHKVIEQRNQLTGGKGFERNVLGIGEYYVSIAVQVEGKTSHPATFQEFVEALEDAFVKVRLTSPHCKEEVKKKIASSVCQNQHLTVNSVVHSYGKQVRRTFILVSPQGQTRL